MDCVKGSIPGQFAMTYHVSAFARSLLMPLNETALDIFLSWRLLLLARNGHEDRKAARLLTLSEAMLAVSYM